MPELGGAVRVRRLQDRDRERWLELWDGYLYGAL